MTLDARIEQFRKMAEADPENELGHFSLGRAYLDAAQFDAAADAFRRVLQINPNMSRTYELLAKALLGRQDKAGAIEQLTLGIKVAHARQDPIPRDAMLAMLRELGASVPDLDQGVARKTVGEGEVQCIRCGNVGRKLARAPFRREPGQKIHDGVCDACWREWIAMGTKVINELRLPLHDPAAQKVYDAHMMEFLNLK